MPAVCGRVVCGYSAGACMHACGVWERDAWIGGWVGKWWHRTSLSWSRCRLAFSFSCLCSSLARSVSSSICGGGVVLCFVRSSGTDTCYNAVTRGSCEAVGPLRTHTSAHLSSPQNPDRYSHHPSPVRVHTRLVSFRRRHSARASMSRDLTFHFSWNSTVCTQQATRWHAQHAQQAQHVPRFDLPLLMDSVLCTQPPTQAARVSVHSRHDLFRFVSAGGRS